MNRLQTEIDAITSPTLRGLVTDTLRIVQRENPDFYRAPSSTSGRYHPEDECAPGGLVLHTRRAVAWGREICRAWSLDGHETDCVTAALILHDTGKRPYSKDVAGKVDFLAHPERAAEYWLWAVFPLAARPKGNYSKQDLLAITAVTSAIRLHMGPWTPEPHRQPVACYSEIDRAVYTADYIASRRDVPK